MRLLENGGRLVESIDELPNFQNADELFLDVETTTFGDENKSALSPWSGARITGVAVATHDSDVYYLPLRHALGKNLPLKNALDWIACVVWTCKEWINHNVKFDAHFLAADDIHFRGRLVCTLTLAKLINSDRFVYSLAGLSKDWLDEDMTPFAATLKPYIGKTHDHGAVPADIEAAYSCQDVITNRKLYRYIQERKLPELALVWENEILLTPVLFDIEQVGMPVDPMMLRVVEYKTLSRLVKLEQTLHEMSGYVIRPHTNTDCFELLCSKWGLPVLGHTEKNEPSFAAPVLKEYLELAHLEAKVKKAIELILEYREKHTLLTMFITPYQESQVDGLMHPDYNQAVRTGRMSCRRPNAQQLSKEAKRLIVVPKDEVFWFWDYSQIEFRLITHYCEIESAITAYNEDPTTDYHNFVADMCGISRAPAKNVNFGVAFGAGKPRVLFMLSSTPDIINEMMTVTDKLIKGGKAGESQRKQLFDSLCRERSEQVYATYHGTFPEIKSTYYRAEQAARTRGFVFNIYGRRRHLLPRFAYKGFNAVIQGSAADLFKEALIKTAPRYNKRIREAGVKQFIMVHDDIGFRVPKELAEDTELKTYIETLLCNPSVPIRVPIRADFQISRKAWNEE